MDEEKQREFDNKTRHLANLEREIVLATNQLPDIDKRKDLLKREQGLLSSQMMLALRDFKIIKPNKIIVCFIDGCEAHDDAFSNIITEGYADIGSSKR